MTRSISRLSYDTLAAELGRPLLRIISSMLFSSSLHNGRRALQGASRTR
jgi:hypothetical protein